MSVLDLSGADTSGFDPVPSNKYNIRVHKVEMGETNKDGKTPKGTPMVKIQLKIADGEFEGRLVFDQFVLPPAGYDKDKSATMLGFFVRCLTALGYDEAKIKSKGFNLENLSDLVGKEAVATVAYVPASGQYSESNTVKGYKPAGSETGGGGGSSALI